MMPLNFDEIDANTGTAALAGSFSDHQFTMVSATSAHTFAIDTEGKLWAWGQNSWGRLGLGDTTDRTAPIQVSPGTTWDYVSAAINHTMAIDTDGKLWAWGNNTWLQLGDGTNVTQRTAPVPIMPDKTWKSVSAGEIHTLAISTDGVLYAWGTSERGQLGLGDISSSSTPIPVMPEKTWKSVSAGGDHTLAIDADDKLWAWGDNRNGRLGDGTTTDRSEPVPIMLDKTWKSVSAGSDHSTAIDADDKLWAWGTNTNGRLGDDSTTHRHEPVPIMPDTTWKSVSAGQTHTTAIDADDKLWAWGANTNGRLGDGTTMQRNAPVPIMPDTNWKSVSAGGSHTMAIDADDKLFAWGLNTNGRLGLGEVTQRVIPTQLPSEMSWKSVSVGSTHTMAIDAEGKLWAWGVNTNGQLGLGDTSSRNIPTPVMPEKTWKYVSVGEAHTMAIDADDKLFAWGLNTNGRLGDNSTSQRTAPVPIMPAMSWKSVSAGQAHTLAIDADDKLFAWGLNTNGQLGDNSAVQRNEPVPIMPAMSWKSVSAGQAHTLAIDADDKLFAWGLNTNGRLGDGTTTQRNAPVPIMPDTTWKSVSAGSAHTVAIDADKLFAWGLNTNDRLGLFNHMIPNQVTVMDRTYQYVITGTTSFTAIGHFVDGFTTYHVAGAVNTNIQNVINAIGNDVGGNASSITFGTAAVLNIGSSNITFAGEVWGEITLRGALESSHSAENSGVIVFGNDVTINVFADVISTAANGNAIVSTNADANIVLGGDPTITGNMVVAPGVLSVLIENNGSGNEFAPADTQTYNILLSGTLSPGLVAVINGSGFKDVFVYANPAWLLEAEDNDLTLKRDMGFWYTVTFDPNNEGVKFYEFSLMDPTSSVAKPDDGAWVKDGHINEGKWYFDADGITEFLFGVTQVDDNITLYLGWIAAAVTIDTTTITDGEFGKEYSFAIKASLEGNAAGPISFELIDGELPSGLSFNSTGIISGIPRDIGEFTFTVRAVSTITDEKSERQFTMTIGGGYYYWADGVQLMSGDSDPPRFASLSEAYASGIREGTLAVVGEFTDNLGTAVLDFGEDVHIIFEGANLTLVGGTVKLNSVDMSDGVLTLVETSLTLSERISDSKNNGTLVLSDGSSVSAGSVDVSDLKVGGDVTIVGDVNVGTITSVTNEDDEPVPVDLKIDGSLDADSVNLTGDVNITEDMNVTGDTYVDGNLNVGGSADIGEDLIVTGSVEVGDDLTVGGSLTVEDDANIGGGLEVGDEGNVGGDLITGGDAPENVTVGGNTIVVSTIAPQLYTGSAIEPAFTVTFNGEVLTAGTDYTFEFANNTEKGTAKLTIVFINEYAEHKDIERTFTIFTPSEEDDDDDDSLLLYIVAGAAIAAAIGAAVVYMKKK